MTPVCTSLVAQTMPSRLGFCDPGCSVGWRIAFYGPGVSWDEVETHGPVPSPEAARFLIASAEQMVADFFTPSQKVKT